MPPQVEKMRGESQDQLLIEEEPAVVLEEAPNYDYSVPLMEQVDLFEPVQMQSIFRRESFLVQFATSKGPPQIVLLMMLFALGFGSTIGVVPAVMTDRYARLYHGFTDAKDCSDFDMGAKPDACVAGSADAQNAAAVANLISNGLTFISSSMIGSMSDEYGRRGLLLMGIFFSVLSPTFLVIVQMIPTASPVLYYAVGASSGLINWMAIGLSALSDVMPTKWRAASFGLLLAGFSLGFAMAPQLALFLDHFHVSLFSFSLAVTAFLLTLFFFPETLPPGVAEEARACRRAQTEDLTTAGKVVWTLKRPFWELSILNRSKLFRLLSILAFFSGMVTSADQTLLLYYVEDQLAFNDRDIALLFAMMGTLGILAQGAILKPLNDCIGEKYVVTLCFLLGALDNFLYGIAKTKTTIFVAICIAAFTGMAFPTISAIKANNVETSEQGRIQGALYSVQALASGVGPVVLRYVYHMTQGVSLFGPGTMFVFASGLYMVASGCACALPSDQANSRKQRGETIPIARSGSGEDSYGTALL